MGIVSSIWRPLGLEVVDADLLRLVRIPARFREQRRYVAGATARLAIENLFAIPGHRLIETACGRLGRGQRQLVEVEGGKLGRDAVFLILLVALLRASGDGIFLRVIETRIVEIAFAMHFEIADLGVPIGHRPPATSPGVIVHARQSERWRGRRLSIGPKCLAVEI